MLRLPMLLLAFFLAGMAAARSKIYYVSPTGTGDGSSWDKATTLIQALNNAVAGDQIWVQGFETVTKDELYIVPQEGFTVKSGVQLYGGFKGDGNQADRPRYAGQALSAEVPLRAVG